MKMTCSCFGFVAGILLAVLLPGGVRGDTALISVPPGDDTRSGYVWGYSFGVLTNDIRITALGFYDQDGDGLAVAHNVGLYYLTNGCGGNLYQITSVTVPSGTSAVLSNGYRWVTLSSPVTIYGGYSNDVSPFALMAVADTDSTKSDAASGTYTNHPTLGRRGVWYVSGSSLPSSYGGASSDRMRAAPNAMFDVIPVTVRAINSRSYIIAPTNATDSGHYGTRGPLLTIDGSGLSDATLVTNNAPIPATYPTCGTDAGATQTWTTPSTSVGQWIQFTFDRVYQVEGFHLWNENNTPTRGVNQYVISNSVDGVTWQAGPVHSPHWLNNAPNAATYKGEDYPFDVPVSAKYIKMTIQFSLASENAGMSEIRFLGFSSSAYPGTMIKIQ